MKKLEKTITTAEDYALFKLALNNYIDELVRNNTELKYIKHWSTFVNNWRDYLEVVEIPHQDPLAQLKRIVSGQL